MPFAHVTVDLSIEDRTTFRVWCEWAYVNFTDEDELRAARVTWVTWDRPELPAEPRLALVPRPAL